MLSVYGSYIRSCEKNYVKQTTNIKHEKQIGHNDRKDQSVYVIPYESVYYLQVVKTRCDLARELDETWAITWYSDNFMHQQMFLYTIQNFLFTIYQPKVLRFTYKIASSIQLIQNGFFKGTFWFTLNMVIQTHEAWYTVLTSRNVRKNLFWLFCQHLCVWLKLK